MIELTLPMPPSANHLWVRARKGMRKSNAYVLWLIVAGDEARKQGFRKITGPYKLSIAIVRPDKRRRDIDNSIKAISDLLVSVGAVEDDYLCEMVSARWVTTGNSGVTVRISPAAVEGAEGLDISDNNRVFKRQVRYERGEAA